MTLSHHEVRVRFFSFLQGFSHAIVPPIPLVPQNDPTTLFTGSGMQQLVPYLLGQPHPLGTRLCNIQPCIRAMDIEEVGDNRHDTFFEMTGNWSLGDYFKKDQLQNFFTFLTDKERGLGLDPSRLYVTAFEGDALIPKDEESIAIWKDIFTRAGLSSGIGERIFLYPAEKNWWSRAGVPANMPPGEPGGPDSEVFFLFDTPHDTRFGKVCHPNCDCGRFLEIGNSVFMQYKKTKDGFEPLPATNVDFGGGLERLLAANRKDPDIFNTDVFSTIVQAIEKLLHISYSDDNMKPSIRIIADHLKTAAFIIKDGVYPSNKEQGYVLRRLIRRALVKIELLGCTEFGQPQLSPIIQEVVNTYKGVYFEQSSQAQEITDVISDEVKKFKISLQKGLKEIHALSKVDGKIAFDLYQTYGFPLEITEEILREKGHSIDRAQFFKEFQHHKDASRNASAGKFKGGLADHSEQTVRYHTATHLLHQALCDVLGKNVRQEGSNITGERLRFDFFCEKSPSESEVNEVSRIVTEKIAQALPVRMKKIPREEAVQLGAKMFFREKYPDIVNVYYIGSDDDITSAYSKEFCGGPHVSNTSEIKSLTIDQCKKIGTNMYRIYAH